MFCPDRFFSYKKIYFFLISIFILGNNSFAASKIWTGGGGDGQWSTPSNWNGGTIPDIGDDVLLDNSVINLDYTITLPNTAVTVKTITINPGSSRIIQLMLPASNMIEPALTITGPGYGLLINNGGVFQNASGLTSGESLNIADSIRINNGGRYIHHTRASHANNITRILSSATGTENGIFEFDVPRASYTVSVSNRIYGTIVFNAAAAGAITYTCTGSNTLTVNGNLEINNGVNLSIDLAGANGNIFIKGDYIQHGGTFNLASGAGNSTIVRIRGNLVQSGAGLITETNTGLPFIELNGLSPQLVSLAGTIANSIGFRMNNPAGATLLSSLQLPYKLELVKGKITTSSVNLLTLQNTCSIIVDSTNSNMSFIDGPLRKEGLLATQFFLFPVGKNDLLRWLELKNVSGNFVVEYIKNNPRLLSNSNGAGIDHISSTEYWTVIPDNSPVASANIELSFAVPESGGITDLSFLNVASLLSGIWEDAGHAATTGTFNTAGSVVSNAVNSFPATGYFALASTADLQNPLPIERIDFSARLINNAVELFWQTDMPGDVDFFELTTKKDNEFKIITRLKATGGQDQYSFNYDSMQDGINYYRLRIVDKNGTSFLSKIIAINNNNKCDFTMVAAPAMIIGNNLILHINSPRNEKLQWVIIAIDGKIIKKGFVSIGVGSNTTNLQLPHIAAGIYQIVAVNDIHQFYSVKFIKR